MEQTRPKQGQNLTKMLVALIGVLAVILVVVICIAVRTHEPQTSISADEGTSANPSTQSQPTQGTSQAVGLTVLSPVADGEVTMEETLKLTGTADPSAPLTVNGAEVPCKDDGTFSWEVALTVGKNEILIVHKGEQVRYEIERRYVLESFAPAGNQSYGSGATIHFEVSAREDSKVTVQFNGKTISLEESDNQLGNGLTEGFVRYVGEYKLTNTNTSDLDLGVATYTVVCNGITEVGTSGTITCKKTNTILASDPSVTPSYGDYINVGSGYIVEIVGYSAETFDGKTKDDYSHPTNNYLPKGTVDYCSTNLQQNGNVKYAQMRCGRRIYVDKRNIMASERTQVADFYVGKLPDHNEIGFVSMETVGNHTVLTLDTLWKAPFYFDILPQNYAYPDAGANRSYEIASFTATYIDITLCYTTKFTGTVQIPEGNSLFKSAELIQNESDCILRLHLKKTGGFYGWDCYYNDLGQLCFEFLNPAKVAATQDNAYGADLTGVSVMIDVGHGGADPGASGYDVAGKYWSESGRNMDLASALKKELESMGATVVLNRDDKVTLTGDERMLLLKNAKPDICIAVHHNSIANHPEINGFGAYYYSPFSKLAAEQVYLNTKETDAYKSSFLTWHNYYVARVSACPVVLTENGYMTSQYDLSNAISAQTVQKKAVAMAQGIADYFLLINK